jgi:hypothetical protein
MSYHQDDTDRLATVREIERMISQHQRQQGDSIVRWAQAQNETFAYTKNAQPAAHVYLMAWVTPEFPITPRVMDSTTDRDFQRIFGGLCTNIHSVLAVHDGIEYSPLHLRTKDSTDPEDANTVCGYEDGTAAARLVLKERGVYRVAMPMQLPAAWNGFRTVLTALGEWSRTVCPCGGTLRFRLGLGDIRNVFVAYPSQSGHIDRPHIVNQRTGWEYEGRWRADDDLDELLAVATRSLARQLQCRWYGGYEDEIRAKAKKHQ